MKLFLHNKKLVFFATSEALALIMFILWWICHVRGTGDYSGRKIYLIVAVLSLLLLVGVFSLVYSSKATFIGKYIYLYILMTALYCIILLPAFIPDHTIHFIQAYGASNILMGESPVEDGDVFLGNRNMRYALRAYGGGIYSDWLEDFLNNDIRKQDVVLDADSSILEEADQYYSGIGSFPYFVPAAGITIARYFNAPNSIVYYSGIWANALFACICLIVAMKICPLYRNFIAVLTFTPTFFWMIVSYSYDNLNFVTCVLLVSCCLYYKFRKKKFSLISLLVVCLFAISLISIKFIYAFMILTVILIPREQISNRKRVIGVGAMLVGIGILIGIYTKGSEIIGYLLSTKMDTRALEETVSSAHPYTVSWVFTHMPQVMGVVIETVFKFGSDYVNDLVGQGSLQYFQRQNWVVFLILLVFIFACRDTFNAGLFSDKDRRSSMMIGIIIILLVLVSMMFVFSVYDDAQINSIHGVQGRYFIPSMLLLPIVLSRKNNERRKFRSETYIGMMVMLNCMYTVSQFVFLIN